MARNDLVLLDSLLEKSRAQFGDAREESELFELFCFDQVLKDYDLSFEEIESGRTALVMEGSMVSSCWWTESWPVMTLRNWRLDSTRLYTW